MFTQHLTTAFVHIRRSPYQAIAAILIMMLTFFVATVFVITAYVMSTTIRYFETRPQVITFLKNTASPEEVSTLAKKLGTDERIEGDVKYVSHEEALRIFKQTADSPLVTELVSPEILPASLEFSVTNLSFTQAVIDEVKKEPIVDRVEFTASLGGQTTLSQVINNLQRITQFVRLGGLTLLSFLSLTALLTLLVVIGMRVASRREEINTLVLLGATPGFIRLPFLLEGALYAVCGAILGFIIATLLFLYLIPSLTGFFGEILISLKEPSIIAAQLGMLFGAEIFIAAFIGVFGAWLAISRYLKI